MHAPQWLEAQARTTAWWLAQWPVPNKPQPDRATGPMGLLESLVVHAAPTPQGMVATELPLPPLDIGPSLGRFVEVPLLLPGK